MTAMTPRSEDSWTFEDLLDLPEDGNRYELIDGRLLVSAAPALPHYRVVNLLHRLLDRQAPEHLIVGQNGGILDRGRKDTYVIPDLLVTPMDSLKGNASAFAPAAALLVVEVLSPGSGKNDNVTKRRHYGRMGIPHYWIVDPPARELHVMALKADQAEYLNVTRVEAGTEWHTRKPFPLRLNPAEFC